MELKNSQELDGFRIKFNSLVNGINGCTKFTQMSNIKGAISYRQLSKQELDFIMPIYYAKLEKMFVEDIESKTYRQQLNKYRLKIKNRFDTKYFPEEKIEALSTGFEINESGDALSFFLILQWESEVQMHQALNSDEFKILSGAINSLCEKTIIRLNDKEVGNHISRLKTIYQV